MKIFRMLGRSIRDAFKSVIRNFSLSLASISCITITLIIVAIAIMASFNVQNFTKEIEKDLYGKGFKNICGIDEAGRGPLAGPVVVAGVIMPPDSMIEGVNDSKKVSEKKREKLYDLIIEEALSYSVAIIGHDVIDEINILNATKAGVTQVVDGLDLKPDLIGFNSIVESWFIVDYKLPWKKVIRGSGTVRASLTADITSLKAQLANYRDYFSDNQQRSYVNDKYELDVKKNPPTIGVIGTVKPEERDEFNRERFEHPGWFKIISYDELYKMVCEQIDVVTKIK